MKTIILQLEAFLQPGIWCRGAWYRDNHNVLTLNSHIAKKFDVLGAIGHLFDGKTAQKIKSNLEAHLQLNAPTFMPHLFRPPVKKPDGTTQNDSRTDYSNLAKFNDEVPYPTIAMFLRSAAGAATD